MNFGTKNTTSDKYYHSINQKGANESREYDRDFPGCPVVKNLPSSAGDVGSIPGWGTKIPHAVRQ